MLHKLKKTFRYKTKAGKNSSKNLFSEGNRNSAKLESSDNISFLMGMESKFKGTIIKRRLEKQKIKDPKDNQFIEIRAVTEIDKFASKQKELRENNKIQKIMLKALDTFAFSVFSFVVGTICLIWRDSAKLLFGSELRYVSLGFSCLFGLLTVVEILVKVISRGSYLGMLSFDFLQMLIFVLEIEYVSDFIVGGTQFYCN